MPSASTELSGRWLTLAQASQLLGVHPMTLRAWVDTGSIRAFRTPGGHRRFQLEEVLAFLDSRRTQEPGRALVVNSDRTLSEVRRGLHDRSLTGSGWYARLTDDQRARQRELGQRLLGLLIQYVSREQNGEQFLREGRQLAQEYGRALAAAQLSAGELARAFLFFRRTIVNAAYHPSGSSAQGDGEGLRLLQRINSFMDELLIATLEAYDQVLRGPKGRPKLQKSTRASRSRKS